MKETKITILLNESYFNKKIEDLVSLFLSVNFKDYSFTFQQTDIDEAEKTAYQMAEAKWPCKELSDKLTKFGELNDTESNKLFRNMDKQMVYMGAYRDFKSQKHTTKIAEEDGDELR